MQQSISAGIALLLAAIVGPEGFGVIAMALAILGVFELLIEQGFVPALVQRADLTHGETSTVFWANIAASLALTAAAIGLAPAVAHLADMPELTAIVQWLSALLLLRGATVVQTALLQRDLNFKVLSIRNAAGQVAGGVLGLTLALSGFGVWSLVAQQLAEAGVGAVVLWIGSDWRPRLHFAFSELKSVLRFSFFVFLGGVGNYATRKADGLVVGFFIGAVPLGLIRLAMRLRNLALALTIRPLQSVMLPQLARAKDDPERLRNDTLRFVRLSMLFAVPVFALLGATSDHLALVLGEKWRYAAAGIALLSIAGLGDAYNLVSAPLLNAIGRPALNAVVGWIQGAVMIACTIAAAAYARGQTLEMQVILLGLARVVVALGFLVPSATYFMVRYSGQSAAGLLRAVIGPVVGGVAVALIIRWGLAGLVAPLHPILALGAMGAVGGCLIIAMILAFDGEVREAVVRVLTSIRTRRSERRRSPPVVGEPS